MLFSPSEVTTEFIAVKQFVKRSFDTEHRSGVEEAIDIHLFIVLKIFTDDDAEEIVDKIVDGVSIFDERVLFEAVLVEVVVDVVVGSLL